VIQATTRLTNGRFSPACTQSAGVATGAAQLSAAKLYAGNALEAALENGVQGSNGSGLTNPYSRKKTIRNLSSASLSAANATPAVLITDRSSNGELGGTD
jgi:hypothetical protein